MHTIHIITITCFRAGNNQPIYTSFKDIFFFNWAKNIYFRLGEYLDDTWQRPFALLREFAVRVIASRSHLKVAEGFNCLSEGRNSE